jgi:hypothetical protein
VLQTLFLIEQFVLQLHHFIVEFLDGLVLKLKARLKLADAGIMSAQLICRPIGFV